MKLISIFLLVVTAAQVSGQIQPRDEKQVFRLKYERYRKARTAGVIMTVAGALAIGDLLTRRASANSSNDYLRTLELAAGEGLLGGGLALTIVGSKKMKQYRLKMEGISPDINVQRYYKYRRMQSAGIGMVVSGILFGAVGISKLQNFRSSSRNNPTDVAVGELMFLGGTGLFGTGIPLTLRGTRKMKQYQQKITTNSLSLGVSPQMRGLTLSLRF